MRGLRAEPLFGAGPGAARGLGDRLGRAGREPLRQGRVHRGSVRAMLADFGCRYVIVGHSERRRSSATATVVVAEKYAAARRAGLTPIFCVGETLAERERGRDRGGACAAARRGAAGAGGVSQLQGAIVAYEPVWAIGTGQDRDAGAGAGGACLPPRARGGKDKAVAAALPILYGGSVKARQRGGAVRDAGRRRRPGRRRVAGGGRIRGDLAAAGAAERITEGCKRGPGAHPVPRLGIVVLVLLQHGKGADMGGLRQRLGGQPLRRRGVGQLPVAHDGSPRRRVLLSSLGLTYFSRAVPSGRRDRSPGRPGGQGRFQTGGAASRHRRRRRHPGASPRRSRSKSCVEGPKQLNPDHCRRGGIGRHAVLRGRWPKAVRVRVSSSAP